MWICVALLSGVDGYLPPSIYGVTADDSAPNKYAADEYVYMQYDVLGRL